jgi:hypothetical protein
MKRVALVVAALVAVLVAGLNLPRSNETSKPETRVTTTYEIHLVSSGFADSQRTALNK